MSRGTFFATSFFGSIAAFIFLWVMLLMNIWPFAVGWSWTDGKDPAQTVFGKLAKTISGVALSPYCLYALGGFMVIGLLVGCFVEPPMSPSHSRGRRGRTRRRQ